MATPGSAPLSSFTGFTAGPGPSSQGGPSTALALAGVAAEGSAPDAAHHTAQPRTLENITTMPKTFGELESTIELDPLLFGILKGLEVEASTELADVACVPESEWAAAIEKLIVSEVIKGALQKGKAIRLVRLLLSALGVAPPALGAPVAAVPPLALTLPPSRALQVASPSTGLAVVPPPAGPADEADRVSLRDYFDQGLRGTCPRLPVDILLAARAHYEAKVDHEAKDSCTPSAEQLSCLFRRP